MPAATRVPLPGAWVGLVAEDELGLTDRAERLVAVGPERRHALDEHGGLDVVSTAEIVVKGRRVVGDAVPRRPEVVMRVDDGQRRVEDVLPRRVLLVDLGEVHGRTFPRSRATRGRYPGVASPASRTEGDPTASRTVAVLIPA